jgi:outer membrane protein assembly factor BamB
MAFKVEPAADGTPKLTPAWNSLDMMLPAPVIIANGMVFALADGDYGVQFTPQGALMNSAQRQLHTRHAVLYALDAATGDVLWSSGDTIKDFSHFSGLTLAGGRLYVGAHDGTVYAFGLGSGMIP